MVCEHYLCEEHELKMCKQEGWQKGKEDERLLNRTLVLAEARVGMQKRKEESSKVIVAKLESVNLLLFFMYECNLYLAVTQKAL